MAAGRAAARPHTRSSSPFTPEIRAQFAQQYIRPPASAPWPTMRQPQWAQVGAMAWMAHSKES
jgi:hypothetical protein